MSARQNNSRAVIWDMDGVIVDSAELHFRSWQFAFGKRNINFTREDFNRHFGQRNDTIIRSLLSNAVSDSEIRDIENDKENYFRADAKNKIEAFPGVISLLNIISEHKISAAVASSAPLENVSLILGELGIQNRFQAIVYGREVQESKPSPQVFLLAAKKLNVRPQNCIVIEDAIAGVRAACAGGMHCIAVTNSHPASKLTDADMVVSSLVLVGIDDLNKLFGKG